MIDEEIRRLERALAADPSDTVALEALAAARTRAGRGWADEPLPLDLRCSPRERGVYVWERRGLGLEMVRVPETPPRHVGVDWSSGRASSDHTLLGDPALYVGRYPVTLGEWRAFMREGGGVGRQTAWILPHGGRSALDHPVVNVTHVDAIAFCEWAGLLLPTAAEWTRAAGMDERSPCHLPGDLTPHDPRHHRDCSICDGEGRLPRRKFPWGNEAPTPDRCVSGHWRFVRPGASGLGLPERTLPVRTPEGLPARPAGASPCGAQDMVGHVWERTESERVDHVWERTRIVARPGAAGGSFRDGPFGAVGHSWASSPPTQADDSIGFRVVLPAPEAAP